MIDFEFTYCRDLHTLPAPALDHEVNLHGGFARDRRPDFGHIYYGMPGLGLVRVDPDLRRQELIKLPADLTPLNFHSVKLGMFDGKWPLFLPANDAAVVAIVSLDGDIDFVLPRPEFEQYRAPDVPFMPTDTALLGNRLYVADGYGANYISMADPSTRRWLSIFGGKTDDPAENGMFGTAHGLRPDPGMEGAIGVELVKQVIRPAPSDQPVGIIQPVGRRGEVELWTLRVAGRRLPRNVKSDVRGPQHKLLTHRLGRYPSLFTKSTRSSPGA